MCRGFCRIHAPQIPIIAVALFPGEALTWTQSQLGNANASLSTMRLSDPTNFNIGRVAVVVGALLVLLPLLMAQFGRETDSLVRFQTTEGEAQVSTDSIARRLVWHIDQLADVIEVHPYIKARGDRVNVVLEIETSPVVDVPMKTEEVQLVTRDIVEGQMGLQLAKLDVRLRHSDFPDTI